MCKLVSILPDPAVKRQLTLIMLHPAADPARLLKPKSLHLCTVLVLIQHLPG